jgi:hypothetical protein
MDEDIYVPDQFEMIDEDPMYEPDFLWGSFNPGVPEYAEMMQDSEEFY